MSDGAVEKHVQQHLHQARPATRARGPPPRAGRAALVGVVTTVAFTPTRPRGRTAWRIGASVLALAALVWGSLSLVNLLAHGEEHFARTINCRRDHDDRRLHRPRLGAGDRHRPRRHLAAELHQQRPRRHRPHRAGAGTVAWSIDASCAFPVAYWCTASYTLRVPRGMKVIAWSGSGRVEVSGTTATVDLGSQHGDIEAVGLRSRQVRATTDHGSVHLQFASAPQPGDRRLRPRRRGGRGPADERCVPGRALDRPRQHARRRAHRPGRGPAHRAAERPRRRHRALRRRAPGRVAAFRRTPAPSGGCPHPRDARSLHGIASGVSVPSNRPPAPAARQAQRAARRSSRWQSRPPTAVRRRHDSQPSSARDLVKTYGTRRRHRARARRRQPRHRRAPVHRGDGPVGLREVDADARDGGPRHAHVRLGAGVRRRPGAPLGPEADAAATGPRGVRLPVLQPRPDAERPGEHRAAQRPGRAEGRPRVVRHRGAHHRSARPPPPPTGRALGRAAAAGRGRPRPRGAAGGDLRRRTHRQPRLARRRRHPRLHAPRGRLTRPDHRDGHPRPERGELRRRGRVPGRRPRRRPDAHPDHRRACSSA